MHVERRWAISPENRLEMRRSALGWQVACLAVVFVLLSRGDVAATENAQSTGILSAERRIPFHSTEAGERILRLREEGVGASAGTRDAG